jgi:hypothetical protein
MSNDQPSISAADRVALLTQGIVVVEAETFRGTLHVAVTGVGDDRVYDAVTGRLGDDIEVELLGRLPRRLEPRRCVGHMEREEGRLQLRYVLRGDEHVDDIVVAEDAERVVVLGTVCSSVSGDDGPAYEAPFHVYLERRLGRRQVVDGAYGELVPYKNVYAEIAARRR